MRVFVDAGGCSGFTYNFEVVSDEELDESKDYVFVASTTDSSTSASVIETKIIIDDITLDMINLSTIDYKEEMIRQSFEVHANPNAELGCSCGVSFSPKNA